MVPEDNEALVTKIGTVKPAGITKGAPAVASIPSLLSFKPVKVADPDTTVNPAKLPVAVVEVTIPDGFTGMFAMLLFFK
jgi:hypothetical protein